MQRFSHLIAETSAQIADAQRVRWLVYGEEEQLVAAAGPNSSQERRLVDHSDYSPATAIILVYNGEQAVGTVRLTRVRGPGVEAQSEAYASPPFLVEGLPADACLAVVERFCVLRRFRGSHVIVALHQGLTAVSRQSGISHWLALANTETDCPQDAALAYRIAASRGLSSSNVRARSSAYPCPALRCTRHLYDSAQRARAASGDLAGLPLPRTLGLFAKRMGGRYAGQPVYDTTFGVFALPLVGAPFELRIRASAHG
jgi:hypothetical protein